MFKSIEIKSVDVVIKNADYIRYEFTTKEDVFIEETNEERNYFAVEIFKGDVSISIASRDEYWVHEDVSGLFNLKEVVEFCKTEDEAGTVHDHTDAYCEWLKEVEGEE